MEDEARKPRNSGKRGPRNVAAVGRRLSEKSFGFFVFILNPDRD